MTDYDRGPASSEPPLAFDPRRPVRGAGPAPVSLIVSALILITLVGGIAFFYRNGVRHPAGPPAEVGRPLGDFKSPAPADASTNDATAGLTIYKANSATPDMTNAAPNFAPSPETPQPRPTDAATPVAMAGPPPPPPPPLQTAKPATAPSVIGELADAAANHPSASRPPAAPAGPASVQIGAFSSPTLADKGWTDIARLEPAAMAGKGKLVQPTTRDGETFYRAFITGFSSQVAAQRFCDQLKAAARPCLVK
jgi:hypothetical protein